MHKSLIRRSYSSHHFDTFKFVQRLECCIVFSVFLTKAGLSRERSEGIMSSLNTVIDESTLKFATALVQNAEFERSRYQIKVDLQNLANEIKLMESNDVALLKSDLNRLNGEIAKVR